MAIFVRFDLRDCGDDDPYTRVFEGTIHEDETGVEVGTIKVYSLDMDRVFEDGFPLPVLFFEQALAPYIFLFSPDLLGEYSQTLSELLEVNELAADWNKNVLIVDRTEILPAYRGRDYGLQAMHTVLKKLCAGHRIAVLKPFPLQCEPRRGWNESLGLAAFPEEEQVATQKLSSHYERLQFHHLPGTELMVLDLGSGYSVEWEEVPGVEFAE